MTGVAGGRVVVLAVPDSAVRGRLRASLQGMRWQVAEAAGGADAMVQMEACVPEALLMDSWLPDLEASEFAAHIMGLYPGVDVLWLDGGAVEGSPRSARRHELLHALREVGGSSGSDGAAWLASPERVPSGIARPLLTCMGRVPFSAGSVAGSVAARDAVTHAGPAGAETRGDGQPLSQPMGDVPAASIEGLIGRAPLMREMCRLIRMVAPRSTRVLIEGETGTGKELVAAALHALSPRAGKAYAVLNCAAIPESLLEAELFGHTRGAFTGAVQSRVGRIEAAHGGTLFLDEIGEMPLPLQAKMLRFLESGELQRVGDNEVVRVDVRVLAATHQPLELRAEQGAFRLDLLHRLAVFPIEVPALRERLDDVPLLSEHFLAEYGKTSPRKRLSPEALTCLMRHDWPGNVRELRHVLERATILAGDMAAITEDHIRLRRARAQQL